jgi:hypothetical protein
VFQVIATSPDPDPRCPSCGGPARLRARLGASDVYACDVAGCGLAFEVVTLGTETPRPTAGGLGGPRDESSAGAFERVGCDIHVGNVVRERHHVNGTR